MKQEQKIYYKLNRRQQIVRQDKTSADKNNILTVLFFGTHIRN